MTQWEIAIPFRSRDESLVDSAWHVRELPPEDREVARELIVTAMTDGVAATAGELVDHLDGLTPGERRAMLDAARVACDLPTTGAVDARRAVEAASAAGRAKVESLIQACAAANCSRVPTTPEGALREVDVVRWWCPDHIDRAAPGDLESRPSPWRMSPSGAIVENDLAAEAAEAAASRSRRVLAESEAATRAVEAAELAATERAQAERIRRETPRGVPVP